MSWDLIKMLFVAIGIPSIVVGLVLLMAWMSAKHGAAREALLQQNTRDLWRTRVAKRRKHLRQIQDEVLNKINSPGGDIQ